MPEFSEISYNLVIALPTILTHAIMPIVNKFDNQRKAIPLRLSLDKWIPLLEWTVIIYIAYFPYLVGSWLYFIVFRPEFLAVFLVAMSTTNLVGGLVHWLFPTRAPRAIVKPDNIFKRIILGHYSLANPYTAMPSLHAAHSIVISAVLTLAIPQYFYLFFGLGFFICISTVTTKEHYLLDLIAGLALGVISAFIGFRLI